MSADMFRAVLVFILAAALVLGTLAMIQVLEFREEELRLLLHSPCTRPLQDGS